LLALDIFTLLLARGVVTGEVKVAQGSTRSRHNLLELLLIVVSKAVLLLVVALVVGVVPVVVVVVVVVVIVLVTGIELLPLGAVGDEVSGVAAFEASSMWHPPLLVELVQGPKLSHQQGDLIVEDALLLFIRSCSQRKQGKLQSR
jgi:hypothetical protein